MRNGLAAVADSAEALWFKGRQFPLVIVTYLAGLYLLRVALFPSASADDAEQLFFAQNFALGYKENQPVLYTWLLLLVQQVLGVSIAAVEAVKFAALAAFYLLVWAVGRRMFLDDRYAVLGALSMAGLYYLAWDSVLNYSHTVLLAAIIVATLYAVMRFEKTQRPLDYVLLGVVIGLGLITKYNYALALIPLVIAAQFHPQIGSALRKSWIILSVALAVLIVLPHGIWLLGDAGSVLNQGTSGINRTEPTLQARALGVWDAVVSAASILSPLLVFLIALFPRPLFRLGPGPAPAAAYRRMLGLYLVLVMAFSVAGVLIAGLAEVRNHWLLPLILFPLWALARIQESTPSTGRLAGFAALLTLMLILVPIGMTGRYVAKAESCRKCTMMVPYEAISIQLRGQGFTGGTIVAHDHPIQVGGNLRRFFPESRIFSSRYESFQPTQAPGDGQCLIVDVVPKDWPEGKPFHPESTGLARRLFDIDFEEMTPQMIRVGIGGDQSVAISYYLLKGAAAGDCR